MHRPLRLVLSLILLTLVLHPAYAEERIVDLALSPDPRTIEVDPGKLEVTVIHKNPFRSYTIDCRHDSFLLPELPTAGLPVQTAAPVPDPCRDLTAAVTSLTSQTSEADVATIAANIRNGINLCSDAAAKARAQALLDRTTAKNVCSAEMAAADELHVDVTRAAGGPATWSYTFVEPSLGVWFATYGFTFLPDRDERYFTRAAEAEEGKFEVVRQTDNQEYDFVPSVLFNYLPRQWRNKWVSWSLTGGLGVDATDDLTVLLGTSALIHQNISVVGGVAIHEQTRLAGTLDRDRLLGEDLTADQLTEDTYDTNFFFGVAFRFGKAPKTHEPPKKK